MAAKSTKKAGTKSATSKTGTDLVRRITWDRLNNKKQLPELQTGDTVGVYVKVKEGEKERVQLFTGVVIKVQGSGIARSFTVRKIASGVGVERTFPMLSPIIEKVELISRGKVRRGRLFYLRGLKGRSARLNTEAYYGAGGENAPGAADEVATEAVAPVEGAIPEVKAEKKAEKKAAKPAKAK